MCLLQAKEEEKYKIRKRGTYLELGQEGIQVIVAALGLWKRKKEGGMERDE